MLIPAIYRAAYMGFLFIANILLANLLEPAGLGQLSLMILNASLVSLITGIGSDAMAMHALAQHKWSRSYGISFLAKMTILQLVTFGVLEGLNWLAFDCSLLVRGSADFVLIELVYFSGLLLTEKGLVAFYTFHQSKRYNFLLALLCGLYLLLLFFLWLCKVQLPGRSLFWFTALHSIGQGLMLLLVFLFSQKGLKWEKIDRQKTVLILKGASVIMVTNVVQLLAYRIDYWLLRYFHSDFEVGLYAQANKFSSLLWLLPNIFAALLIPKFSNMHKDEVRAVFRIANGLNLIMAALTVLATWIIYQYFLLPEYLPGLGAFWLMLPGYFCWALGIYFGAYFSWAGAFTTNLICSSGCLLLISIADLLLIPHFSISGAAMANTIAYTFVLLLYFYCYIRKNGGGLIQFVQPQKSDLVFIKRLFW